MISKYYGKSYSRESLRERTFITKQGVTLAGIAEAAESIGFRSLGLRVKPTVLFDKIPKPCIVPWRQKHFIVLIKVRKNTVYVADPAFGLVKYNKEEFLDGWNNGKGTESNYVLVLDPTPATGGNKTYSYDYKSYFCQGYVRLKIQDHDGSYKDSKIESFSMDQTNDVKVIGPNPTYDGKVTLESFGNDRNDIFS